VVPASRIGIAHELADMLADARGGDIDIADRHRAQDVGVEHIVETIGRFVEGFQRIVLLFVVLVGGLVGLGRRRRATCQEGTDREQRGDRFDHDAHGPPSSAPEIGAAYS
jgi:hypothetical protein